MAGWEEEQNRLKEKHVPYDAMEGIQVVVPEEWEKGREDADACWPAKEGGMGQGSPDAELMEEIGAYWREKEMRLSELALPNEHSRSGEREETGVEPGRGDEVVVGLERVGGVDISFVKDDPVAAVAVFSVLAYPSMEVLVSKSATVALTQPYIPGFLAFREVDFFADLYAQIKEESPDLLPQIIVVDGNGILHRRAFGLASHLGVLLDIPTIGVGKSFYAVDGVFRKETENRARRMLTTRGSAMFVVGESGRIWGAALQSGTAGAGKPIFVSCGHRVGLLSALVIVWTCCTYKIPEPVRHADLLGRELIRSEQANERSE